MKKAKYILFEGVEGVGKTTQVKRLIEKLKSSGKDVLETKEPGTPHSPLTMALRKIMLDNQFDEEHTKESREMISQAIRSIHLNKVVFPALDKYDYIVQDRGLLSGLSYGIACDNPQEFIEYLSTKALGEKSQEMSLYDVYDHIIVLSGSVKEGLKRALEAKKEFETGDAMESRGVSFLDKVNENMTHLQKKFKKVSVIDVSGKTINEVHQEILKELGL